MSRSWLQKTYRALRRAGSGNEGLSLAEILIALGIMAAVAVIFLIGLQTSSHGVMISQARVTADSLAKSQLEYIKSQDYDSTNNPPQYTKLASIPERYDITISAARMDPKGDGTDNDDGIQQITVTITHDEETELTVLGYKVDR